MEIIINKGTPSTEASSGGSDCICTIYKKKIDPEMADLYLYLLIETNAKNLHQ
jgi:hypothetical protein